MVEPFEHKRYNCTIIKSTRLGEMLLALAAWQQLPEGTFGRSIDVIHVVIERAGKGFCAHVYYTEKGKAG